PVYYYTDRTFEIKEKMEKKTYQELFYIDIINANKRLTDEDIDSKYSIGQEIIKYISQDEDWKKIIEDLPEDLSEMIDTYEKREMIQDKSLNKLKKTIQEIEQTNGGKSADMFLDIVVRENTIKSSLNNTIQAKYQFEDAILDKK